MASMKGNHPQVVQFVFDLEQALCDILRGSGSDVQIVNEAMKRYAAER